MQTNLITITLPFKTLYLTHYHRDLTVSGQTYTASLLIDKIEYNLNASVNADTVRLNLMRHKNTDFNNAIIEISDYDLVTQQIISPVKFYGTITDTYLYDTFVTIHAFSTKERLERIITRTYNKNCAAGWGDNRCGINKELYKQEIEITTINNNMITYNVLGGVIHVFYNPYLSDTLGNIIPIYHIDTINYQFQTEPFYNFKMGQIYSLYAGCKKTQENCLVYHNLQNYLGFFT